MRMPHNHFILLALFMAVVILAVGASGQLSLPYQNNLQFLKGSVGDLMPWILVSGLLLFILFLIYRWIIKKGEGRSKNLGGPSISAE